MTIQQEYKTTITAARLLKVMESTGSPALIDNHSQKVVTCDQLREFVHTTQGLPDDALTPRVLLRIVSVSQRNAKVYRLMKLKEDLKHFH